MTPDRSCPPGGHDVDAIAAEIDEKFASAFVLAVKPERNSAGLEARHQVQ